MTSHFSLRTALSLSASFLAAASILAVPVYSTPLTGYPPSGSAPVIASHVLKRTAESDNNKPDPASAISPQANAPDHLITTSHHGLNVPKKGNYYFPANAGEGVKIFIIDTGLNINHPQVKLFQQFGGKLEFKTTDKKKPARQDDRSADGHGSCVWQYAASPKWGVAKKATTVIVQTSGTTVAEKEQSWIEALDIVKKDLEAAPSGRAVINISNTFTSKEVRVTKKFREAIEAFEKLGALVVFSAGNYGPIKDVPDIKCDMRNTLSNVLIVGASTEAHGKTPFTNTDPKGCIDVWARGDDLACIKPSGDGVVEQGLLGNVRPEKGTSFAVPQVAGAAAVMWADKDFKTAKEVRDHINSLAHPRVANGPKILYNGYDSTTSPCKFDKRTDLNGTAKAGDGFCVAPARPFTTANSTATATSPQRSSETGQLSKVTTIKANTSATTYSAALGAHTTLLTTTSSLVATPLVSSKTMTSKKAASLGPKATVF